MKLKFVDFQDPNQKDGPNSGALPSANNMGATKIIVNINGTTNINNYHNLSLSQQANIKGRKIDMPQLRLGKEMDENMPMNMQPIPSNQKLNQKNVKKSTGQQQPMKSAKNSRMTHKGLMQQSLNKTTNKHNEGMKKFLQQTLNMTSVIHNKKGPNNM